VHCKDCIKTWNKLYKLAQRGGNLSWLRWFKSDHFNLACLMHSELQGCIQNMLPFNMNTWVAACPLPDGSDSDPDPVAPAAGPAAAALALPAPGGPGAPGGGAAAAESEDDEDVVISLIKTC
jgi:hypothetical protein